MKNLVMTIPNLQVMDYHGMKFINANDVIALLKEIKSHGDATDVALQKAMEFIAKEIIRP